MNREVKRQNQMAEKLTEAGRVTRFCNPLSQTSMDSLCKSPPGRLYEVEDKVTFETTNYLECTPSKEIEVTETEKASSLERGAGDNIVYGVFSFPQCMKWAASYVVPCIIGLGCSFLTRYMRRKNDAKAHDPSSDKRNSQRCVERPLRKLSKSIGPFLILSAIGVIFGMAGYVLRVEGFNDASEGFAIVGFSMLILSFCIIFPCLCQEFFVFLKSKEVEKPSKVEEDARSRFQNPIPKNFNFAGWENFADAELSLQDKKRILDKKCEHFQNSNQRLQDKTKAMLKGLKSEEHQGIIREINNIATRYQDRSNLLKGNLDYLRSLYDDVCEELNRVGKGDFTKEAIEHETARDTVAANYTSCFLVTYNVVKQYEKEITETLEELCLYERVNFKKIKVSLL